MVLSDLLQEVYNRSGIDGNYIDNLLRILKERHFWPSIKIKKFKDNKSLCLLHNSYKDKDNVNEFKELYDECRSVVLDFSRSMGNNVVINCASSIPIRMNVEEYGSIMDMNDRCYISMEGTMITCYYHNGNWIFGSSCCPDINSSKFSHPTKTHGYMLDEVLYEIYKTNVDINNPNISMELRKLFTGNLSPLYSYEFILVHYENKHILDYTNELGMEYKYLYHINTKNRITLNDTGETDNKPLEYLGIRYPHKFMNVGEGINYLMTNGSNAIIIKRESQLFKIGTNELLRKEEVNANNYNIWYNLFYVYMLQKPNYNVNEYLTEFYINNGKICENITLNPYDDINTIFNVLTLILYNLYIATTNYYPKYKRFKVNMDIDRTLNPVIRFHLAQLRYKQTIIYTKAIITKDDVFKYLCHFNNIKNIKKLVYHISTVMANDMYNIPQSIIDLFKQMNENLNK